MERACPFSNEQHAFQEGKSTETALHALTTSIEESLSQKEFAMGTFLDIEGAFDNIPFTEVDKALLERGLSSSVRRWIMSLLQNRAITYETYGTKTSVTPTRGTPQGGVLSPTLWTLVIDELLKRLRRAGVNVIGYADDIAIICRGKFLSTICETTQYALSIVERWCEEVELGVNASKTELLLFTQRRKLDGFVAPKLFGRELEMREKVKYLGVIFTSKLNWSEHIAHRINKCIRVF